MTNIFKQPRKLCWVKFDDASSNPPKTSDGKKYLCVNFFGEMQVCLWDGITGEWIYDPYDFIPNSFKDDIQSTALMLAVDMCNKRLPKSKQITPSEIQELDEVLLEKCHASPRYILYFDNVEWYMELPSNPAHVDIKAIDGDSIQADIFEQELDLMAHIENAVREYSSKNARILKSLKDAP